MRFNKVPSGEGGLRPTNKKLLPLSSINNFIKYKKSKPNTSVFGTIKSIILKIYPTPRIALFVRSFFGSLVTKFQPPGVLDASGVLDAA